MKFFYAKGRLIASTAILAALLLVVALVAPPNLTSAASDAKQETKRTINVSGRAIVKAEPDIAYVTLGTVTENKNAKAAQQENAKVMDTVIAALKGAGISEKDIKTQGYNISPKYSYDRDTGVSNIVGYRVSNNVQVTVRDLKKVGNVIDVAASSGANQSSSISFSLSDYDKIYNQALKNAVENAKTKASTIADTLGIKLTVPATVTEGSTYSIPSYTRGVADYDMVEAEAVAPPTPIAPGSLEVTATVSVTYEY